MSTPPPANSTPARLREDATAVVRRLRDAGHVAYFAGGCVRDALLGLEPKDYDVATDAPPGRVRELFSRTQAVGAAFGVILVRKGESQIEVATFRSDGTYADGRRPKTVTFTTAEEDAKRRDFTINGMFFDPIENKVIDYVGGQADLRDGVLRAIGVADERFAEDHLRVLRVIRFAARFDLTIEAATRDAMVTNVLLLTRISPERIADELRQMLSPITRGAARSMIRQFGVEEIIFRFLKPATVARFEHVRSGVFERISPIAMVPFGLALAAIALEFQLARLPSLAQWENAAVRGAAQALRQSLRISNEEVETMEGTLYGLVQLFREATPTVAMMKRFLARPTASLSRELFCALLPEWVLHRDTLEAQLVALAKTDFAPPPLVTGDDLTAAGSAPGRAFKKALDEAYDAQLEGRVTTKEHALELALGVVLGSAEADLRSRG